MPFYPRLANTSFRLLSKYGQDVVLSKRSVGGGDYDPATGTTTPATPIKETRKAILMDQPGTQIGQRFGTNLHNGTKVETSEKWVYMDAKGSPPELEDVLIARGVHYTIIDVQELSPAGFPMYYQLVCRA